MDLEINEMPCVKGALATLLFIVGSSPLLAENTLDFTNSAVVLDNAGPISLDNDEARMLFDKAIEIIESSNFNSSSPKWTWDEARINLEYGRAVAGRHLLISFDAPKVVKTVGGDISVRELILGFTETKNVRSVHTIDSQGQVIGHAKYQGHLCIELQKLVDGIEYKSPCKLL